MTQMHPILTVDEAERQFISDKISTNCSSFAELDMKPYSLEETMMRFVKLYIPAALQKVPLEQVMKKVCFYSLKS